MEDGGFDTTHLYIIVSDQTTVSHCVVGRIAVSVADRSGLPREISNYAEPRSATRSHKHANQPAHIISLQATLLESGDSRTDIRMLS